jgi:predicted DNA-binding ribbon-helix-helix protein
LRRLKKLPKVLKNESTKREVEEGMCHLFASQHPDSYVYETRSIRLNGQSTSIRLEKIFWNSLEQIAEHEGLSVPSFISTLHHEVLLMWGAVPNFTSHLRCICLVALEKRASELATAGLVLHGSEHRHRVVGG